MSDSHLIGIDLGGTKCACMLFEAGTYREIASHTIPTRAEEGFPAVLSDLQSGIDKIRTPETIAIGIGIPGLMRQPEGMLLRAPNIPQSNDVPVKRILEDALQLPVFVGNDANCFALAEALMGNGKGKRVVVGITFGTGVGGGIVIDGRLFQGGHGFAAEIGHMLLMPGTPPYKTDDKRGDVEQFLSGTAMGKRCEEATTPEEYLNGAVCSFMRPAIYREIAWLCTSITHLLDPDVIVFGGSAGKALEPHLTNIQEELDKWLLPDSPVPDLAIAKLPNAGALGAALLTEHS